MSLKKISDLFYFEKGSLQSTKCTPGEFNFITASSEWKTHNEFTHECEALIFAAAASGSLGRTHYVNGKFISSDLCFIITPKDPVNFPIDIKFYHLIFETFKEDIVKNTKAGTSKEAIGLKSFGNYKLPYFEINKQISTREQFVNAQISKTELVSEFTHQFDLVKQLRQAFLREAMQGKLTAKWRDNNPDVEPASELLKKIKVEKEKLIKEGKLKKDKLSPAIKENEIPFEIPESWEWCKIGDITYSIVPNRDKPKSFTGKIPWITQTNFSENSFKLNYNLNEIGLTREEIVKYNCRIMPKDSVIMSCVGRFDLVCSVEKDIVANQQLHCFVPISETVSMYLIYAIKLLNVVAGEKAIHTTIKYLNKTKCESIPIPLPPLSEKQQIVTKLDELMQYCDDLEKSIKTSQQQNEMLLQQVLREALEPKEEKIIG
jgi:type I restriction enzyme S subunit